MPGFWGLLIIAIYILFHALVSVPSLLKSVPHNNLDKIEHFFYSILIVGYLIWAGYSSIMIWSMVLWSVNQTS